MTGDMVVVTLSSRPGSLGSVPHSSQHKTQYFHSFTILLASIFSSALSPRFSMLDLLMLILAVGSNFCILIPVSHNSVSFCVFTSLATHAREMYFCSLVT